MYNIIQFILLTALLLVVYYHILKVVNILRGRADYQDFGMRQSIAQEIRSSAYCPELKIYLVQVVLFFAILIFHLDRKHQYNTRCTHFHIRVIYMFLVY